MTLARLVRSPAWQALPTYAWESGFAVAYLVAVTLASTDWSDPRSAVGQVLSSVAVYLSFQHMSVGARLEEAQERSDVKLVACYRKLTRYLVAKEALWVAAFVALGAWTALAGVPLFLLYPAWRRAYRQARHGAGGASAV